MAGDWWSAAATGERRDGAPFAPATWAGLRARAGAGLLAAVFSLAIPGLAARAQQSDTIRHAVPDTTAAEIVPVTEAYPGLLLRAKVNPIGAIRAALAKVKHGKVTAAQIEERGQRLVYVLAVEDSKGRPHEVLVDAETGRVLSDRKQSRSES
jgi:uncharacterized membrane protein YkoI